MTDTRLHEDALDGMRGVAALLVVASHLSHVRMHLMPGLDLAGIGKPGVYLFFVLSAFLLPRQLLSRTPAELAVMRLSARGLATKEVAHRLGIRFGTVRRHRQNAYGKVGASSLAGALWAMGWVRLP